MKSIGITLILVSALTLLGCGQEEGQTPNTNGSATAAQTDKMKPATLPEGFLLPQAPNDAIPISQARASAKPGADIAITGYIGGRAEPFSEGRAIFLVADSENAPACEDECGTPWDACCTPTETIAANSATIQILDGDGKILRLGMKGHNGLVPGAAVTVVGKAREANDAVLIVDASGIAVRN